MRFLTSKSLFSAPHARAARSFLAAAVLFVPASAAADSGTSAAPFLTLGLGSRAQGLANGVVALADDASAAHFNPAGLARSPREFLASHSLWVQDIGLSQAALAMPVARVPMAFSLTRLGLGGIERRTAETSAPEGTFGAEDLSLGVSAALPMGERLSLGATAKLVQQRIDTTVGRTFAADAGILLRAESLPMSFGASVRNVGPGLKLGSERYPLPSSVHVGAAWTGPVTIAAEASRDREGRNAFRVGTEHRLSDSFTLRGGYLHQNSTLAVRGAASGGALPLPGLSAGFGVRLAGRVGLDYAVVPFRDLGTAHRFSLSLRF